MPVSNDHFEHRTIDGDRWDLLAYRYYGDANRQHLLQQANRALFLDPVVVPPMILPAGMVLTIPVIDDATLDEHGLPPWKRAQPTYGN